MKTIVRYAFVLMPFLIGCKKGNPVLTADANEVFWLSNEGADMPVWVKGNTASHVMILFLHGGPGDGAYSLANFQTSQLWTNYSFAYWDQRDAGSSAGNSNYSNMNLKQMIEDLAKLVEVIHSRYGNGMEVFLMGHSFGALLGCGYLTENNNQNNIQGWIEVDGAHDYPQADRREREMLIDTGTVQIQKGLHVSQWQTIVDYCRKHPVRSSVNIGRQTDEYADDAEGYVISNQKESSIDFFSPSSLVSLGTNLYKLYYTSAGQTFLKSLMKASYSNQLDVITVPSLLIWGQYDFTVPMSCGTDALSKLGSTNKTMVVIPEAGHKPFNDNPDLFAKSVKDFIEKVK